MGILFWLFLCCVRLGVGILRFNDLTTCSIWNGFSYDCWKLECWILGTLRLYRIVSRFS